MFEATWIKPLFGLLGTGRKLCTTEYLGLDSASIVIESGFYRNPAWSKTIPPHEVSQEAQAIANGHAWNEHRGEFPELQSQDEFARLVDGAINNASEKKQLSNGRTAYWDDTSKRLVITDPGDKDGGTAFRPTGGKDYFDNLR